ncbi:hypothetical protein YN1_8390 [Nanoarchaeota archaeon]
MNESKEKYIYLDSNILVDCYLDKDYLELLKSLKSKYNISYIISYFVIYEIIFVLLKNRIAECLIKEKGYSIEKIIHKWRYPHAFYKDIKEDIIMKISEEITYKIDNIFRELNLYLLADFEKEEWKEMIENIFLSFPYYGIHMEDAIHLTIASYFDIDYFLTTDSEIIANKKLLKEEYGIIILEGLKDKIKNYMEKGLPK